MAEQLGEHLTNGHRIIVAGVILVGESVVVQRVDAGFQLPSYAVEVNSNAQEELRDHLLEDVGLQVQVGNQAAGILDVPGQSTFLAYDCLASGVSTGDLRRLNDGWGLFDANMAMGSGISVNHHKAIRNAYSRRKREQLNAV